VTELPSGRWWIALVTFERDNPTQDVLPDSAWGACGWMFTSGRDEDDACGYLKRDIEHHGLKLIEVEQLTEVFGLEDIETFDDHLAANVREFEEGHRTALGAIHCYKGDGEA